MSSPSIFEIDDAGPTEKTSWNGFDINLHVSKNTILYTVYSFGFIVILTALSIFVIFPIIFIHSISLQRLLIFTHFNQPKNKSQYQNFYLPGLNNRYVTVKDLDGKSTVELGVWHLLPVDDTYVALHDHNFDYDKALENSTTSILMYFHGTGECRSDNLWKYQLFRNFFHVITFDYRCYGDSQEAVLSEDAVVNDCVQLYRWLANKTKAPIYVWGHSLGSALATRTLRLLHDENIVPKALILESAFTCLNDELYVHPYVKYLSWLPYFNSVIKSLNRNGFIFNTAENIQHVSCPIMLLQAEDDQVVSYKFGRRLYEIAQHRPKSTHNLTVYYEFDANLQYDHNGICNDPYLPFYLMEFMRKCEQDQNQVDLIYNSMDQ